MIRVRNLNKTYDAGHRHANHVLRDVTFTLPDTGFVCIVGASGCGKTSLLNAVGGLDSFDNGTIATGSVTASRYGTSQMENERNNSFGYIFQNYYLLSSHSVAYNVYLGLHALGLTHKEKLARVREALKAVGMERYTRRTVSDLSGGQQQRVAIARALARRPRVIFADEPTGNLDEKNTINICTLLRRISKTSLVVMVTHEENIARFFADRIITVSEGRITGDSDSWERGTLRAAGSELYAGDYEEETAETEQIKLRVLHEKDAAPVELTVAVLKDRVIIKLDDGRTVSCSTSGEEPIVMEGKRPELHLESVDNEPTMTDDREAHEVNPPARAGSGLTPGMMLDEARRLLTDKGRRFFTTWIFLAAMAVLTTFIVSDYITVSSIDPHDFILTDSHILQLEFERDAEMDKKIVGISHAVTEFLAYLGTSGLDYDALPGVSTTPSYSTDVYIQMGTVSQNFSGFSHALIDRLDESKLIYGRMPEKSDEIVVDRWVLDDFLSGSGVLQSSIPDITDLLGAKLSYRKLTYAPTIVGICDCGDPTVYLTRTAYASIATGAKCIITLSELQAQYPSEYYNLTLGTDECIIVLDNAGTVYRSRIGQEYSICKTYTPVIVGTIEADTWAYAVIPDDMLNFLLLEMTRQSQNIFLYCEDKQAMKDFLSQGLPEELRGQISMEVHDAHGDAWAKYQRASNLKADARTIVTVTIIALCMVMLYLLQRSCVQQRIGMMAVYRLLGIPGNKLMAIFATESVLFSLSSVLPAVLLTWAVIRTLTILPSLEFSMILSLPAAMVVFAAIAVYYLLVSLLPVRNLLRLPPARLAAKYDI